MKVNNGNNISLIPLEACDEEKDLGVIFDSALIFDSHIQSCTSKANRKVGLIRRTFVYLNKDIFCKLYKALVILHLEYAEVVWYPSLKRQSIKIIAFSTTGLLSARLGSQTGGLPRRREGKQLVKIRKR